MSDTFDTKHSKNIRSKPNGFFVLFLCISFAAFISAIIFIFWDTKSSSFPKAILVVEPKEYDFGTIEEGVYIADMKIINRSNKSATTFHVISGCTCTNVSVPHTEIKPGQSIDLQITFDSHGRQGNTDGLVMVAFIREDDPSQTTRYVMAYFHANVVQKKRHAD